MFASKAYKVFALIFTPLSFAMFCPHCEKPLRTWHAMIENFMEQNRKILLENDSGSTTYTARLNPPGRFCFSPPGKLVPDESSEIICSGATTTLPTGFTTHTRHDYFDVKNETFKKILESSHVKKGLPEDTNIRALMLFKAWEEICDKESNIIKERKR